jgi:ELWxxDGT repeat protein
VFFSAANPTHGRELWASDATPEGTGLVADINAGSRNSTPAGLTAIDQALFFRAEETEHGAELWKIGALERRYEVYLPMAPRQDGE